MDRNRLGAAALDALWVSVLVGGLFAPPDPFAQIAVVPVAFLVVLLVAYRRDLRLYDRGWDRHVLFVVVVLAAQFVRNLLVRLGAVGPQVHSPGQSLVVLAGVALAAWLAYFGGLERLRAESA